LKYKNSKGIKIALEKNNKKKKEKRTDGKTINRESNVAQFFAFPIAKNNCTSYGINVK